MKITRVEPIPVCVPLKKGLTTKTAHGEHAVSAYVIVRVHTDEGPVGVGECTVAPRWSGETSRSCVAAVEELIGPALAGQDPTRVTALRAVMDRELKLNPFTKAGVEMALWDLAGKATGVPVYQLLGGKVRDAVPIKMVVGAFDVGRARALAEQFLSWGVRCLKVKVGLDPEQDVARVRAVRQLAGPKVLIGVDANCGWDPATARRVLGRLREADLLFDEQPIPPGDPAALARLRRETDVPLMADESVFTLADAWQLAAHASADVLSVYPGKHGGIAATAEVAAVARAAGMACALGSNLELGVGTAAMLHLAVALSGIASEVYPADAIGPLYHEADLLTRPLALGPEVARVPEGPGLGVELDAGQLRRWRQT
jgi:L-alanine-DL-glutamate epimerase-like enolase superfamily enzyme